MSLRYRRLKSTGAMVLVKSCEVCAKECSFILVDKAYCREHLPAEWFEIERRVKETDNV